MKKAGKKPYYYVHTWELYDRSFSFPGVNVVVWLLSSLLHSLGNVHHVGPVSSIEGSGEHVGLVVKLSLGLIQVDAWSLNGGLNLGLGISLHISSGGEAEEHNKYGREFHLFYLKL